MRTKVAICSAALGMAFAVSAACACEGYPPPAIEIDRPIQVSVDGSFVDGGEFDNYGSNGGSAITDIGNSKIGQRLFQTGSCFGMEQLLVVDCVTREMILVNGTAYEPAPGEPVNAGEVFYEVANLQPPKGPIALTANITIDEIAIVARANGIGFTREVMARINERKRLNRYDPFNGCKIFYPDSPGAKL